MFMAAVLFSWKKGVETSTLFVVMFMVCIRLCLSFFRAGRRFQFYGDASVCFTNIPLSLGAAGEFTRELRGNLHGSCGGIYTGVAGEFTRELRGNLHGSWVDSHATPRERGVFVKHTHARPAGPAARVPIEGCGGTSPKATVCLHKIDE